MVTPQSHSLRIFTALNSYVSVLNLSTYFMAIPEYPIVIAQSPTHHSGGEERDHGALLAVAFLHLKFPNPEK